LAKLNSVCGPFIRQRNEIRRPSSASTSAPTSGPKRSTEVKANTSETEKRDWIDGILMLSVPLSTVSTANSSHSPGIVACHSTNMLRTTTATPQSPIAPTKSCASGVRPRDGLLGAAPLLTTLYCPPPAVLPQTT
jgi:hypothetical protein